VRSLSRSPKRRRKRKKPKKAGPKRGKSAYIFYTMEKRSEVKAANPTASMTDVTKKMAETWNALSAEDKKHYQDLAAADKLRFETEKNANAEPKVSTSNDTNEKVADEVVAQDEVAGAAKAKEMESDEVEEVEKPKPKAKAKAKPKPKPKSKVTKKTATKKVEKEAPAAVTKAKESDKADDTKAKKPTPKKRKVIADLSDDEDGDD